MKKFVIRSGISVATLGLVIAGAAAFSAYEAHIVNVTATIENALSVDGGPMAFGTVFPQEYLLKDMNIKLSDSFLATSRVDDIEYVIKQKPMVKSNPCLTDASGVFGIKVAHAEPPCTEGASAPGDPYANITVGQFTGPAWQYCEENLPQGAPYVYNPADEYWKHCYIPLSNYLSKHGSNPKDKSVDAFHQAYTWDGKSLLNPAYIAGGRLSKKDQLTSDKWTIDLAVPCFKGECAQDWASFVKGKNELADPNAFILPQSVKGQTFGTQLWVEVTGVSMCTVENSHTVVSDTSNLVTETSSNAVQVTPINSAWTASIPGATWIWSTNPVEPPTSSDNTKTFTKSFTVSGTVGTASLDIATDNFFTVYVNGVQVGSEQSSENNFQLGTQHHYTITNLVSGSNSIRVVATNKGVQGSTPETNPAGVLYKLTYSTVDACTQPK